MLVRLSFVLISLFAAGAFAQAGVATCVTSSAGFVFRAQDSANVFAQQAAIANCQKSGSTLNSECQSNVVCDNGVYAPATCQTASSGFSFKVEDTFEGFSRLTVVANCKKSGSTSNAECERNVVCANPNSTPATCQAASAGYLFSAREPSMDLARVSVIAACKRSGSTSNAECENSVTCDDGHQPIGSCQTTSASQVFRASGMPLSLARQKAITDCKHSGSTSNSECESKVICAADVVTKPPVPPPTPSTIPTNEICTIRETQQTVEVDQFYATAGTLARASNNCLIARIVMGSTQVGRIYRADGGRLSKGADLSNQEIVNTLAASGLTDCSKLTCELR